MFFQSIAPLVFPDWCVACDKNKGLFCESCRSQLHFLETPAFLPSLKKRHFENAFSGLAYEGLILDLIHQYKYHRQFHLIPLFAEILSRVKLDWGQYDAFAYVPLHWWRRLRRGFNPSHFLTHALAKKKEKPILACLKRVGGRTPQTRLNKEERLQNVRGAFWVSKKLQKKVVGKNLLLIDDVLTTGATVNECAKVLRQVGAKRIAVLTLARTL